MHLHNKLQVWKLGEDLQTFLLLGASKSVALIPVIGQV